MSEMNPDLAAFVASQQRWEMARAPRQRSDWYGRRVVVVPDVGEWELTVWAFRAPPGDIRPARWGAQARCQGDVVAEWYGGRGEVIDEVIAAERALFLLARIPGCESAERARDALVRLSPRQIQFLGHALGIRRAGSFAGILEQVIYRVRGERIDVDQWRLVR